MIPNTLPSSISHTQETRLYRVGATPVLEVTVTYPTLPAPSPAAQRFNEAYRAMAEAFFAWAESTPAAEAAAAFCAMERAAYTFDRRLITCTMTAEPPREGADPHGELRVTRTVIASTRRGTLPERRRSSTERWRTDDLTLLSPHPRFRGIQRGTHPRKTL